MKKMDTSLDAERFHSGAEKYAAYLETPEGRLRLDLAFANLQEFLPRDPRSLRALDVGCGTGAMALRLAQLGLHVTLLDSSPAMLDFAKRSAQEAKLTEKITVTRGEGAQLSHLFEVGSFDVILCHNTLEYVGDPRAVLRSAAHLLRGSSSIMSILVRNQRGEVLKAALQNGDLAAAEGNLTAESVNESLYGGTARLFTPESLHSMLAASSLAINAELGIRIVSDFLPTSVSRNHEYERIFVLERKLGARPEFAAIARYTHYLAHPAAPVGQVDE
ncbi:MAG: methyltransferase domain-containing protein [Candidatus Sulfotelmatobacter sp.]